MKTVYLAADNIYSPLGSTSGENFSAVRNGFTGICAISNTSLALDPFYSAMFPDAAFETANTGITRFEKICIASIEKTLAHVPGLLASEDTIFILSTTKGNIELIENEVMNEELRSSVSLSGTAMRIGAHFKTSRKPLVVSHACISGVLAILIAKRMLQSGSYKHAVITGADVLSRFIISGFQSLKAMSSKPCKPFDQQRDGINLGECAATVLLSTDAGLLSGRKKIAVNGGASTNDAHHISAPSRSGDELANAIRAALRESEVVPDDLSFVSAHGTATIYNDEMESKAFVSAGLSEIPLHSLKGNFGHTLGAAGVLESVLSCHSLLEGIILPSKNFETMGVSGSVQVNREVIKSNKQHALKTASGFGGSNAAIIYSIL